MTSNQSPVKPEEFNNSSNWLWREKKNTSYLNNIFYTSYFLNSSCCCLCFACCANWHNSCLIDWIKKGGKYRNYIGYGLLEIVQCWNWVISKSIYATRLGIFPPKAQVESFLRKSVLKTVNLSSGFFTKHHRPHKSIMAEYWISNSW